MYGYLRDACRDVEVFRVSICTGSSSCSWGWPTRGSGDALQRLPRAAEMVQRGAGVGRGRALVRAARGHGYSGRPSASAELVRRCPRHARRCRSNAGSVVNDSTQLQSASSGSTTSIPICRNSCTR